MKSIRGLLLIGAGLFVSLTSLPAAQLALPAPTAYQVVESGAHHNVWQRETYATGANGQTVTNLHKFTELATGLNHLVNSQWVQSKEEIKILPNGTAAATNGQHQAYFPGNIYNGVIRMVTPDGEILQSRPAGLSYDDGTNMVLIAELTNSIGCLVGANQVVYPNAFTSFKADLRYTYTKAGFEQDVILRQQPPTPESLGLNADTAKLQVLTEFFSAPAPAIQSSTLPVQAGLALADHSLGFGQMQMNRGRAFLMGQKAKETGALVGKQWVQLDGRQFLVEEVPVDAIVDGLAALPLTAMNHGGKHSHIASRHLTLPPQRLAKNTGEAVLLAKADLPAQGFVLDYQAFNGSTTNFTFRGDTTYYVSGAVNLRSSLTNIIEGGTVVKFGNAGAITVWGPIVSKAAPYRMAVFTSKDDNSVGEILTNSTGNPTNNGATYFNFFAGTPASGSTLAYLRFAYAGTALYESASSTTTNINAIWNCQFMQCNNAIFVATSYGHVLSQELYNVLFANCGTAVRNDYHYYYGQLAVYGMNVTADQVTNLLATWSGDGNAVYRSFLANGLLTGVQRQIYFADTNASRTIGNTACLVAGSGSGIYQAAAGGNYYLANGSSYSLRNAGTTNINSTLLSQLRQKTTYPPVSAADDFSASITLYPRIQRDTDTPDLGYHYDPIDYLTDSLTVEAGAALTLTNGVVLALTSPNLTVNGTLLYGQQLTNAEVQEAQSTSDDILTGGNAAAAYADADGNGLPDWWENYYFGTNGLAANSNPDGDGNTLLYDYLNGVDPNKNLGFTVRLGNRHFNTTNASGSYLVLNAVPGYEAVLVNNTNFESALWTNYDGAVHLNLGPTDGVYQVWIGVKGHAPGSQPVWMGTTVYLDRVPPAVTITSPTNGTVASPVIQLQGFGDESLLSVTYDLSNAVAVVTNQPGQLLGGQFFDTNTFEYTTDYFQGYDLDLTNGLNVITVHATDLAGNVTTTNINVTLDYTTATNPVIQLTWPQNGMQLCGSSFTVRGLVDDSTAQVTAQITDHSGGTNIIMGSMERDGKLWAESLPLAEGTNILTLYVTNSAGLSSATNIMVVKSGMTMALTTIDGDLWFPTVSVSGTISDPSYTVWVNGMQGTNYGNGTWSADNVPVSPGGVASFDMSATAGGGDPDASTNLNKPTEVVLESGHWKDWGDYLVNNWSHMEWDYSIINGGSMYNDWWYDAGGVTMNTKYRPDKSMIFQHSVTHSFTDPDFSTDTTNGYPMDTPYALGMLTFPPDGLHMGGVKSARVKYALHTGGKAMSHRQSLFRLTASVTEEMANAPYSRSIPVTQITVAGKALAADGVAWAAFYDGTSVDVTPQTDATYYDFTAGAQKYHPYIGLTTSTTNANLDTDMPEVCVGQTVLLAANWQDGISPPADADIHWSLPDKYVNERYQYSPDPICACISYRQNSDLLTNRVIQCWYVNGNGQPQSCSVRENLHFANGQSVTVVAAGNFTVYRPTANQLVTFGPFRAAFVGSYPPMLELADNAMYFTETISSKYSGSFGLTQLVKMYSETVLIPPDVLAGATTFGSFNLDINPDGSTGEYYDGPKQISETCKINDPPGQPLWFFMGDYTGHWQDYVRFTPDGGIPVTLGRIDWNWAATAENPGTGWYITSDGVDGPTLHNDDAFPLWMNSGIIQFPIPIQ